jgi:predicted RNase H-like HicB family nuclease
MKKFTLTAVLYPQVEGGYSVVCPELSGCVSEGESVEDALRNIREAAVLMLEDDDAKEELEACNAQGRMIANFEIGA